jgi:hypothetical protein
VANIIKAWRLIKANKYNLGDGSEHWSDFSAGVYVKSVDAGWP